MALLHLIVDSYINEQIYITATPFITLIITFAAMTAGLLSDVLVHGLNSCLFQYSELQQ